MAEQLSEQLRLVLSRHRVGDAFVSLMKKTSGTVSTTTIGELLSENCLNNIPYSRYEIIQFFKGLATTGSGTLRKGRRGHPSRFVWATDARELLGAALSDMERPAELVQSNPKAPAGVAATGTSALASKVPTLIHQFNLRAEFVVTLELPADLTPNEAQRLQQFVAALPIAPTQPPVQ